MAEGWGGRTEFVAEAVEKLKLVRAAGVSSIVDLTPMMSGATFAFSKRSRANRELT